MTAIDRWFSLSLTRCLTARLFNSAVLRRAVGWAAARTSDVSMSTPAARIRNIGGSKAHSPCFLLTYDLSAQPESRGLRSRQCSAFVDCNSSR